VLDEAHEVLELDDRRRAAAAAGQERRGAARPRERAAPSSVTRSKLHARAGTSAPA
jgi:hypothetical protein